jgi:hypothetical protein
MHGKRHHPILHQRPVLFSVWAATPVFKCLPHRMTKLMDRMNWSINRNHHWMLVNTRLCFLLFIICSITSLVAIVASTSCHHFYFGHGAVALKLHDIAWYMYWLNLPAQLIMHSVWQLYNCWCIQCDNSTAVMHSIMWQLHNCTADADVTVSQLLMHSMW